MRKYIYYVLALLLGPCIAACSGGAAPPGCRYKHEVPSGAVCGWKTYSHGHVNLGGCDDGRQYYNPEWSKETKVCE